MFQTLLSSLCLLYCLSATASEVGAPQPSEPFRSFQDAIDSGDNSFETLFAYAQALALAGKVKESHAQLHRLLDRGYNPMEQVENNPAFNSVRSTATYESLQRRFRPCNDGPYSKLNDKVGRWEIYNGANEDNKRDQSIVSAVAGGCAIYEKYWTSYGYESESFYAYNKLKQQWTMVVVDNQGFFLNFSETGGDNNLILTASDDKAVYEASFQQINADQFQVVWKRSLDNGQNWHPYVDSLYKRKKED